MSDANLQVGGPTNPDYDADRFRSAEDAVEGWRAAQQAAASLAALANLVRSPKASEELREMVSRIHEMVP